MQSPRAPAPAAAAAAEAADAAARPTKPADDDRWLSSWMKEVTGQRRAVVSGVLVVLVLVLVMLAQSQTSLSYLARIAGAASEISTGRPPVRMDDEPLVVPMPSQPATEAATPPGAATLPDTTAPPGGTVADATTALAPPTAAPAPACFIWPTLGSAPAAFSQVAVVQACGWADAALTPAPSCVLIDGNRPPMSPLSRQCDPDPCLLLEASDRTAMTTAANVTIDYSVVFTAYRSGDFLGETLGSFVKSMRGLWELIVVVDGHEGQTEAAVLEVVRPLVTDHCRWTTHPAGGCGGNAAGWNASAAEAWLVHVRVLVVPMPVFETGANNAGMRAAVGRYLILVQDDMFMGTPGFNELLAYPLYLFNDVLAVSGRCAHQWWSAPSDPAKVPPTYPVAVGRCGPDIGFPLPMPLNDRRFFYIRDTVNRGPLVYRADRIRELLYLDEEHFHIGSDDHDAHCRAFVQKHWVTGFVAVDFVAPLEYGATRRLGGNRPGGEAACLRERQARAGRSRSFLDSACPPNSGTFGLYHCETRLMCPAPADAVGQPIAAPCARLPAA